MKKTRILALLLALCLTLGALPGCAIGKDSMTAATYQGGEIPAGVYIYYLVTSYNNAYNLVEDPTKDVLKQTVEGKDASEWITSQATDMLKAYAAVEVEFEKASLTLGESEAASAESSVDTLWDGYGAELEKFGIARSSVSLVAQNDAKSRQLQLAVYGEGGAREIPENDLKAYYEENYRRAILLVLSLDNLSEEELAARKRLFGEYYDRVKNGEALYDLIVEEYARQSSMTLEETQKLFEGNTQEIIVTETTSGYPAELLTQIFDTTEYNAIQKYESASYDVLFEVRELMGDGYNFTYNHDTILTASSAEDYEAFLLQSAEAAGFATNSAAVKRYTPKSVNAR